MTQKEAKQPPTGPEYLCSAVLNLTAEQNLYGRELKFSKTLLGGSQRTARTAPPPSVVPSNTGQLPHTPSCTRVPS